MKVFMLRYLLHLIDNNNHLSIFFSEHTDKCHSKGGYTAWTGGRNETKEMNFIWSESGEKVNYTNWNPPNPDNYRNQEYCIQILDCGRWNDNNCNRKLAFICEKNLGV